MAAKKSSTSKKKTAKNAPRRAPKGRTEAFSDRWHATVEALSRAECEIQKQLGALLSRKKLGAKDVSDTLKQVGAGLERQRKQALADFEAGVKKLRKQVAKEQSAVQKTVDDAVQRTLSKFNIPSRTEVAELTRKVNRLSKQIDALPRRTSPATTRKTRRSAQS
jgi:polyhydroxyalkanoate synthesis regulator phasin